MISNRAFCFGGLFLALVVLLSNAGCARTQPSRFYALTPVWESRPLTDEELFAEGDRIGVGPVEIPSYLDRPQIVTQKGFHQVHLAEYDRWAGSLKENINTVIAENLSALLPGRQVFIFPWKSATEVRYQIVVRIIRFDPKPDEQVGLDAYWAVLGGESQKMLFDKTTHIRLPLSGKSYNDIVGVQSMALGELSREIAEAIMTLPVSS